jgi:hypothetical protein
MFTQQLLIQLHFTVSTPQRHESQRKTATKTYICENEHRKRLSAFAKHITDKIRTSEDNWINEV